MCDGGATTFHSLQREVFLSDSQMFLFCFSSLLCLSAGSPYRHEWVATVPDRHVMAKILNHHSRLLQQTEPDDAMEVFINGVRADMLRPKDIRDPIRLTLRLLKLYEIWNREKIHVYSKYNQIRRSLSNLKESVAEPVLITLGGLQMVHRSLRNLFADTEDADCFYSVLYYKPYVSWASRGSLQFIASLGSGSQADVIMVRTAEIHSHNYTASSSSLYALKIFNAVHAHNACQREERVMHQIQTLNISGIPRIFGEQCKDTHSILMEYINGHEIAHHALTPQEARSMLSQLTQIIVRLGAAGIGHYDLNDGNIIKDVSGNYWLIDFGLSARFPNLQRLRLSELDQVHFPIIGTFMYLSPRTITLNAMVSDAKKKGLKEIHLNVTDFIIKGNLHSLQALVFVNLIAETDHFGRDLAAYRESE